MKTKIRQLLDLVIPFRFLPSAEKDFLASEWTPCNYEPFQLIFSQNSLTDEIYLLEEGQVELLYGPGEFIRPANVVRPGHYFGERAALLKQPRTNGARAVTTVKAWSLSAKRLLELIGKSSLFAQTFGTILRDKHGIFLPLENFSNEVAASIAQGSFRMDRLVEMYRTLAPALHPLANDPDKLDLDALSYAIRRLPENVTTTFAWFFTDDIPVLYTDPSEIFTPIVSQARRRDVWEMLPGKNMVLLRSGLSDILDFLTCLCVFAIESQKIRTRLHEPGALLKLRECKLNLDKGLCEDPADPISILKDLPFSPQDSSALYQLWGTKVLNRLYELTIHHEDWAMVVERQLNNYNSRRSEKWANLVSKAIFELTGINPWDLPQEFEVHIISSNTHSVTNCLSPFARKKSDAILQWAKQNKHPNLDLEWSNRQDLLYSLIPEWFKENSSQKPTGEQEKTWGILRLDDQSTTGIAVQLIDTSLLGGEMDPSLPPVPQNRRILIVNIDYAFGVQAEEIMRNLITLFPGHIRSISIMGKAGALQGSRGDILTPSAFVLQSDDSFFSLPHPQGLDRLSSQLPQCKIFQGPLLTVDGTLLQNRPLLNFYKNIWKCTGLEMEGVFYARQIIESIELGVLSPEVIQRYFYYVSDLPLEHGAQLSQPMKPSEGVPPLYGITREILSQIFE